MSRGDVTPAAESREGRDASAGARVLRGLAIVAILAGVSVVSIAVALRLAPAQTVRTFGQTIEVGATSFAPSISGPGEVVLFGRTLPTQVEFVGPVRPRLVLTDISVNEQVAGLLEPGSREGSAAVGEQLARGWRRYFVWEMGIAALVAFVLLGAIAGWRRYGPRKTAITVAGGLGFVVVANLGVIMITAFTAPAVLRDIGSLNELVGREEIRPIARLPEDPIPRLQAVVIGDSVAAGLGGPPPAEPTEQDLACRRSTIAFAETLARVNDWEVENVACSGASIAEGILGPQSVAGRTVPPQLSTVTRATHAEVVVVNVGANDVNWSVLVRICAASDVCDDRGQTAYFQRLLDRFARDYYELLRHLAALPGDPLILVHRYYLPFDPEQDCLEPYGLTGDKLDVLSTRLETLNETIAAGARSFGFTTVQPNFTGHDLCSDQSYVQGFEDPAPLHPNARGHLAIALADERALLTSERSSV